MGFAVRNVAKYSPPVLASPVPGEWETLLRLTGIVTGQGPDADIARIDAFVAGGLAAERGGEVPDGHVGPERLLDIMLRSGPYDLTLDDLIAAPHGVDCGPLVPQLPDKLSTESGLAELAPAPIVADVPRLVEALSEPADGMVLIGRRHLRSNNSWMHNIEPLVKGKDRCTAWLHPEDAARLGLADGGLATVSSRAGTIDVPVEVTDLIMPGVVSIPHGWGHDADGIRMGVARAHAGVNSNRLADELHLDPLSGNAVLNGIPVQVVASAAAREATTAAAATP
jgi:hypothetical protein